MEKLWALQIWRCTSANASLKVGCIFRYQALARTGIARPATSRSAMNVTRENNPNSLGVVRAIARRDHCR